MWLMREKKGAVRWDLGGPISSGNSTHCSHTFFMSIPIEFSTSYCILPMQARIPTQARSGDPRQVGAVSVGPIWHACIAICPAEHRSYCILSQNLVTPTSLTRLIINAEFCQCPLRRLCQLQLHQLVIGSVTVHLMKLFLNASIILPALH